MLNTWHGTKGGLICLLTISTLATASRNISFPQIKSQLGLTLPRERCPPCFNCLLPAFTCGQYGECDPYNGQCKCPPGWSGIDCLTPQCDSLADGEERKPREDGKDCDCKEGWTGVNCNVCGNDNACANFPLPGEIVSRFAPGYDEPEPRPNRDMTCYKSGPTVFENHQQCKVTNRKIVDILPDRPPQVTFSCHRGDAEGTRNKNSTCSFQFFAGMTESFYCGFQDCDISSTNSFESNSTSYKCEKMQCKCIPGRFICGEDGSVDIGDFLRDEIRGPAKFKCETGKGCTFSEDAMNDLILTVFGDSYITLDCDSGECLHYSQVPGYVAPPKPDNTKWIALSAATAGVLFMLFIAILWYAGRPRSGDIGSIRLPDNEASKLMTDHVPSTLQFSDVSYRLSESAPSPVLEGISGIVKSGQVLAIMGASGAGKSTLLDILARNGKHGLVSGLMHVNGRNIPDSVFKNVVGFVDQEDTLMSTLTVYETILYSALLRLPREMSKEAKEYRVLETMNELGILGIKDSRIGSSGKRSISGGEKRRVSIACELVTSPSILFLDEPTSGLDAYNAHNVIESLVSLARNYNRTVIFTIHQPRSNIVALFDQLLLLAKGKLVYSGPMHKCQEYFASVGSPCPPGYNIADFLVDLTVEAGSTRRRVPKASTQLPPAPSSDISDAEIGFGVGPTDSTELQTRQKPPSSTLGFVTHKTSQILNAFSVPQPSQPTQIPAELQALVDAYASSAVAADIKIEMAALLNSGTHTPSNGTTSELRNVEEESTLLKGRNRASHITQFTILSGRAFKNLYRDPALLASNYTSAIALALLCSTFYYHVSNDIAGFQNRLGVFFFTLAFFGFSCLSGLGIFANERLLFLRERANGYYSPFTYFASKVMFDILPLRLVPPLVFGAIVYPLVGLVPEVASFWKFQAILVLFNLTTASVILLLSIVFADISVASLVGTMVMLFNLLFTGLLINRDSVPFYLQWLHTISFFHAAFEALAVNELRYLQLKEHKFGIDIDVPSASILSTFGLRAESFWWPNLSLLGIFFATFIVISYAFLHRYVKEKR